MAGVAAALGLLVGSAWWWWQRAQTPPAEPPRHIVLISLDTFRADHMGCYGNAVVRTPSLDALAAEGVRFADVTSSVPTTLASHVSLFTGTWPNRTGVVRNGFVVNPENVMLPEILAAAGYRTAGFIGSFALTHLVNFDQGFDHWDEDFDAHIRPEDPEPNQRRAAEVTDAVLAWLDAAGTTEPTFLFAHYFDAHHPYEPPPPFDHMYEPVDLDLTGDLVDQRRAVAEHHEAILGVDSGLDNVLIMGLPPELVLEVDGEPRGIDRALAARYAGEVTYLDQELGRLFAGLRARGIWDEALVIVTADHGETFWEHGDFWNHGLGVYQTTLQLPLIVKPPRVASADVLGRVVSGPVAQIDVLPTILELCDLPRPEAARGMSLVPALAGAETEPMTSFAEATQPSKSVEKADLVWLGQCKAKAARLGRYKLIWTPYLGIEELYDLDVDPGERHNLMLGGDAGALAAAARLRSQLEDWTRARPLATTWYQGLRSGPNAISIEDMAERLEGLGYVGGPPNDEPIQSACE